MTAPATEPAGNDRDKHVVEEICGFLTAETPSNFFLFAGAGSGKTRTLVEVLRRLTGVEPHEKGTLLARRLRSRGQSIRIVTYTKNAVAVVKGRLGNNDLTSVSTIHAFCWDLIAGFDDDIRDARIALNSAALAEAQAEAASRKRGPTEKDREKIAAIEAEANEIRSTKAFLYHPDRNTYGAGAMHHAQVIAVTGWMLKARPTLQKILMDRHPIILIDESQDTMKQVLDALIEISGFAPSRLTLGLLGDHRQRIYAHGHDDLPKHIPDAWKRPALQMNHRSQERIVSLVNHIWETDMQGRTQSKTGGRQFSRTEKNGGSVRLFIGDSALGSEEKIRKEVLCAEAMAEATQLEAWRQATKRYKVLTLEHKLAARRGDFLSVYEAMALLDPDAAGPQGNGENNGPAVVQPLLGPISELAACVLADGTLDEFSAMEVLRRQDCLAQLSVDSASRQARLAQIHQAVTDFAAASAKPKATVRDILDPILRGRLFDMPERLVQAFEDPSPPPEEPKVKSKEPKDDRRRRGWHALFGSPWKELGLYRDYLKGQANLATHQVVKGSEFEHVMVVMDDADAGGFLFSYDKLFGAAKLSDTDLENASENKETTIDRTLRLLYVTCSRARESLVLVLWAKNPSAALARAQAGPWFEKQEVTAVP